MSVYEIVFSPTGGTEKVARIITEAWGADAVKIDLSSAGTDFSEYDISGGDMAVIAMPSFGGLAPAVALERLGQIRGNGASCAVVCVYGNRAYEDTLAEMEDAAAASGFRVVAAVAAVAEHSIMHQYAAGRPDDADTRQLRDFAGQILGKTSLAANIPGNRPYKKAGGASMIPKPSKACVKCGLCAKNCPVGAIDTSTLAANGKVCISCMRCVERCPKKARSVSGALVSVAALALKKACSVRKENELYL